MLFALQFQTARKRAELRERCSNLKFMLSEESLQLLPEYNQRIEVHAHYHSDLHKLDVQCIDVQVMQSLMFLSGHNVVELKGCVACEIHSHEVLLTELLFMNMFSQFEPAEIAALLSCIVFQQVHHTYICITCREYMYTYTYVYSGASTSIILC